MTARLRTRLRVRLPQQVWIYSILLYIFYLSSSNVHFSKTDTHKFEKKDQIHDSRPGVEQSDLTKNWLSPEVKKKLLALMYHYKDDRILGWSRTKFLKLSINWYLEHIWPIDIRVNIQTGSLYLRHIQNFV